MHLLNCLLYLLIMSIVVFIIGRLFPRKLINENKFPFKIYNWEKNGKIYDCLKIKKWKTRLPDASVILNKFIPKIYPKKRMKNKEVDKAFILVKESCVAEMTHKVVSILGFFCIKICRKKGFLIALVYYIFNIPFVLIQRYNRPRFLKLTNKIKKM